MVMWHQIIQFDMATSFVKLPVNKINLQVFVYSHDFLGSEHTIIPYTDNWKVSLDSINFPWSYSF